MGSAKKWQIHATAFTQTICQQNSRKFIVNSDIITRSEKCIAKMCTQIKHNRKCIGIKESKQHIYDSEISRNKVLSANIDAHE